MRYNTKMPAAIAPVAADSTVTFNLPVGRRYHWLTLIGGGAGLSFGVDCLREIRVMANSKIIQRYSGSDRNAMNLFQGRESATIDDDNFNLVIPFDRYNLGTRPGEEETAINTGSADKAGRAINQFKLEVDIASSGFTGTPSLRLTAEQSEALEGGAGTIPYILKSTRDYNAAARYDLSDLPRGGVTTQFLEALYMKPSVSTLENLEVLANNTLLFQRTAAENERIQRDGVRVPQAGWYNIDGTEFGYAGQNFDLRGLADFVVKFDTGAALQLVTYAHYLGGLSD